MISHLCGITQIWTVHHVLENLRWVDDDGNDDDDADEEDEDDDDADDDDDNDVDDRGWTGTPD